MNDAASTSLAGVLKSEDILVNLRTETLRDAVSQLLAKPLARAGLSSESVTAAVETVMKREADGTTCIPPVALPHGRTRDVTHVVAGLGIKAAGVVGERPEMKIILAFVSPLDASSLHLRFLSEAARVLRQESVVGGLLKARDAAEVLAIIRAGDR
jgi:mannitol/fructose-specific phosphotransferase system IIA component (Ntr-type)